MPLLSDSVETTNDITNTIEVKNTLNVLSKNIKIINSLDSSSRMNISINVPSDMIIYSSSSNNKNYIYTTVTLSNGTKKRVQVEVPCKISFNGNVNHYYSSLKKRWYYNTEISVLSSDNGQKNVNINFR